MANFGALIREARERRGIRPKDLAAALGRTPQYVSQLENDRIDTPPPDVLAALWRELGIPEAAILRCMGYLTTMPDWEVAPAFPAGDPRADIAMALAGVRDEDLPVLRSVVEKFAGRSR